MPRPETFWNFMASGYARQAIADPAAYAHKLKLTQAYLTQDMDVLEVGCGTGGTALIHAPHVRHIRAVDFSEKMIAIARERQWNGGARNVTFAVEPAERAGADPAAYDVAMALSLLHLVRDRQAVLARLNQALKPGGLLATSTVCVADMTGILPKVLLPLGSALGLLPQVARLTGDDLRHDMRSAGFDIIEDWRPAPDRALFLIARKTEDQRVSTPDINTYAAPPTRTPVIASGGPNTSTLA